MGCHYSLGLVRKRLIIEDSVLAHFSEYRQNGENSTEAGGQLFGKIADGNVVVSHATGPNKRDGRSFALFVPKRSHEQGDINRLFKKGFHYIGDWHTHPQRSPRPSSLDLKSISDTFIKSRHDLDSLVLVIVGTDGLWVSLHTANKYKRLKLVLSERNEGGVNGEE